MRASALGASTSGSGNAARAQPVAPRAPALAPLSSGRGNAARAQPARSRPVVLPPLRATPPDGAAAPPNPPSDPAVAKKKKKPTTTTTKKPAGSRGQKTTTAGTTWSGVASGEVDALGRDRLTALGKAQDYNINVTHGQNLAHLDSLFVGKTLGHETDIADGSLRRWQFRTFANLVGDYYVAPSFLNAVADHLVKNALVDAGSFDAQTRVPLILGIWGGKGQGKSFQTELALKKLGAECVVMSAGELEDEWAGVPGKRIRERYRAAADLGRVRGKLTALVINDIDAGAGVFKDTQRTVNTQMVIATLMACCDDPNHVPGPGDWRAEAEGAGATQAVRIPYHRRVPIILTGNDLSRLFAPLLRDGRMSKFYWHPSKDDLMGILGQLFRDDLTEAGPAPAPAGSDGGGAPLSSGLTPGDLSLLLDAFPNQSLDFYGACKSGLYDDVIRAYVAEGAGGTAAELAEAEGDALAVFIKSLATRQGPPPFDPPPITLDGLMAQGRRLVAEQEAVNTHKLAEEYMGQVGLDGPGGSLIGLTG